MNMNELFQHIRTDSYWELFGPGDYSNATRFLYTAILSAAHDQADTLVIRVHHLGFKWYKAGQLLETILWSDAAQPFPGYDVVLRSVFENDPIVKQHLSIVAQTDDEITVRID
jgi:hypothetical protein